MIHQTAIVSSNAKLGADVTIGPFAIIEDDVEIGDGSVVDAQAILKSGTRLGRGVKIGHHSVIGGLPQDLHFDASTKTYVEIGDETVVRESVTVSRATKEGQATRIGSNCFLMATCHVAHDCVLGNGIVVANAVLLAGHVQVGDNAFLGGAFAIHQFCRIGTGSMCGGGSQASMDIAPYVMFAERNILYGLNVVGLKRRKVERSTIDKLQHCYREVYLTDGNVKANAARLLEEGYGDTPETKTFLTFFEQGKRGFVRPTRSRS